MVHQDPINASLLLASLGSRTLIVESHIAQPNANSAQCQNPHVINPLLALKFVFSSSPRYYNYESAQWHTFSIITKSTRHIDSPIEHIVACQVKLKIGLETYFDECGKVYIMAPTLWFTQDIDLVSRGLSWV